MYDDLQFSHNFQIHSLISPQNNIVVKGKASVNSYYYIRKEIEAELKKVKEVISVRTRM